MKTISRFLLCLSFVMAAPLFGEETAAAESPAISDSELDDLLGPIALYPDALVALILPASTVPTDVVLAARFLEANPAGAIDDQPWDESVKALAHYPGVIRWLSDNLEWTRAVGEAFVNQPAAVMEAVQRLRAKAQKAGTLTSTPEQQVVVQQSKILIVPTQPSVIYVPYYDPVVVFVDRPHYRSGSHITFSIGYHVGPWLRYGCDWGTWDIWYFDRGYEWRRQRDWRRPELPDRRDHVRNEHFRIWRPSPRAERRERHHYVDTRPGVVHPRPMPGSDNDGSRGRYHRDSDRTDRGRYHAGDSDSNRSTAPTSKQARQIDVPANDQRLRASAAERARIQVAKRDEPRPEARNDSGSRVVANPPVQTPARVRNPIPRTPAPGNPVRTHNQDTSQVVVRPQPSVRSNNTTPAPRVTVPRPQPTRRTVVTPASTVRTNTSPPPPAAAPRASNPAPSSSTSKSSDDSDNDRRRIWRRTRDN